MGVIWYPIIGEHIEEFFAMCCGEILEVRGRK
jgi:hypothetical protein